MKKLLLTGVAAIAFAGAAHAAPINGTASVSNVGVTGPAVLAAGGSYTLGTSFNVVGNANGQFVPFVGTLLDIPTFTASVGETFSFTSNNGDFTGTIQIAAAQVTGPLSRVLDVYVLGNFTPEGTTAGFDLSPASVTIAFSQTGPSGSVISSSFTLAAPPAPPPGVPAPAALGLFGLALAGLGLAARARRS